MEETVITSPVEAEAVPAPMPEAEPTKASAADSRREEFEQLIRGEYKAAYDERVQKIIDRRFRETKTLKEQARRAQPLLDYLKSAYGEADEEALLKRLTAEREAHPAPEARAEARHEGARQIMTRWQREAAAAQKLHPGLDLEREARNGRFGALLRAGVNVGTAYEVVHAEELMQGAMRYAAERARERTLSDIRARGLRPEENGADGRGATRVTPPRVKDMTRAQREDIERRAARGEKVYFN